MGKIRSDRAADAAQAGSSRKSRLRGSATEEQQKMAQEKAARERWEKEVTENWPN